MESFYVKIIPNTTRLLISSWTSSLTNSYKNLPLLFLSLAFWGSLQKQGPPEITVAVYCN